jgi:hypothetical protein
MKTRSGGAMVRGPYAPERSGLPFILPALAHC